MDPAHVDVAAKAFLSEGWDTFDKSFDVDGPLEPSLGSPSGCSVLPSLLEEAAVEDLLDEPDIVQECRCGNIQLQDRLCSPPALCVLVEYITSEPAGVPEPSSRRRPYVAAELLSCDRLLEALLASCDSAAAGSVAAAESPAFEQQPHGGADADSMTAAAVVAFSAEPQPSDLLWCFLDTDPHEACAPVLAGYFYAIAASLFIRGPERVAGYLQQRGTGWLLARLLLWLELRCIAELLSLFLCASGPQQVFPPGLAIAGPLLDCLRAPQSYGWANGAAAREHAALVLDALLSWAAEGAWQDSEELLGCLGAADVIAALVEQVVDPGSDAAVSAAIAALLSGALTVIQRLPPDVRFPPRGPELRSSFDPVFAAGSPMADQAAGGGASPTPEGAAKLQAASDALLWGLCARLPELAARLPSGGALVQAVVEAASVAPELPEAIRILLRLRCLDDLGQTQAVELTSQLLELGRRSADLQSLLERRGWSANPAAGAAAEPQVLDEILVELRQRVPLAEHEAPMPPQPLGIHFEGSDVDSELLITEIREGLMLEWNEANPEQGVRAGDQLVGVIGCGCEDTAKRLRDALSYGEVLQLRVRRLQEPEPCWAPQLPELIADLRAEVQRRKATMTGAEAAASADPGCPAAVAGGALTIEVLRLLMHLAMPAAQLCSAVDVPDALARAEVLQRCLRALLTCRWSSVMHCALGAVLAEAIQATRERCGLPVVLALIEDTVLMRQLVSALCLAREAREVLAAEQEKLEASDNAADLRPHTRAFQAGSLGVLRLFASQLCACAAEIPEIAAALDCLEGWSEVVVPEVEYFSRLREEPLGGPLPSLGGPGAFDCLAAVQAAVASGAVGEDNEDFSLEDLRDLNEELDMADLIQMSDLHKRRRAKAGEKSEANDDDPLGDELEGLEALNFSRPDAPSQVLSPDGSSDRGDES